VLLGFMIGVRPAGLGIFPIHVVIAWLRRPQKLSAWLLLAIAILPIGLGVGAEKIIYRAVHGDVRESQTPGLMLGLAAMLIGPETRFAGSHAATLDALGSQLYAKYLPWRHYAAEAPSLPVLLIMSAAGQASAIDFGMDEFTGAAEREHTSVAELKTELAKQVILQNFPEYLKLVLLNQYGEWSVDARVFPPTARALAAYTQANPELAASLPPDYAVPTPSRAALVVYPAFLAMGALTLTLSVVVLVFLWRPGLLETPVGFYLGLAAVLSAMCQTYTFVVSMVISWQPRYLMAVFPQMAVVALCLIMVALHWSKVVRAPKDISWRRV
jgi:hypothetical protein